MLLLNVCRDIGCKTEQSGQTSMDGHSIILIVYHRVFLREMLPYRGYQAQLGYVDLFSQKWEREQ